MSSINLMIEDNISFHIRVCGILRCENKVLLQINEDGLLIPGGHVEFIEDSKSAIIREMKEELDLNVSDAKLIGVGEIVSNHNNFKLHMINFFYELMVRDFSIPLEGVFKIKDENNVEQTFQWFDRKELDDLDLQPIEFKKLLLNKQENIIHFIHSIS